MFSLWAIAKPSYYFPCLPGMALLIGAAWVRLGKGARGHGRRALASRLGLHAQWVLIMLGAAVGPRAVRPWISASSWFWPLAIALMIGVSVIASILARRRGADELCLPPIAIAFALGLVIAYSEIVPRENALRGHRMLAASIRRIVPGDLRTLMFFDEVHEGLWFYLNGIELAPVPGTQPRYSAAYDLLAAYRAQTRLSETETLADIEARRESGYHRRLVE